MAVGGYGWGVLRRGSALAMLLVAMAGCSTQRSLVFDYSGVCEKLQDETYSGFATPLTYYQRGKLVEAPDGFAVKNKEGELEPVKEFNADKKYYLYDSDGNALGSVHFLETVVTDRGYGSVDHSHVLADVPGRKECGWFYGTVTDYPLTPPRRPVRADIDDAQKTEAIEKAKAYLGGKNMRPEAFDKLMAEISVEKVYLAERLPVVIARSSWIEAEGDERTTAGFQLMWLVADKSWRVIYDEFIEEQDYMGIGEPLVYFSSFADLDGDGDMEVTAYESGCDYIYKYRDGKLSILITSCNGYITE